MNHRHQACDPDAAVPTRMQDQEQQNRESNRRFKIRLVAICMLALVLRSINVMQTRFIPTSSQPLGDSERYLHWASEIAAGNWFGSEPFYQAPLYPYLLALTIKCFGPSIISIRVIQTVLGSLSVALIGLAGRRMFSAQVGLVAAAMLAAYPPAIFYDGIIQKASLASALVCGLIVLCAYLQTRKATALLCVLTGVVLGLLVLTRENALVWVVVLPVWFVFAPSGLPQSRRLKHAASCLLGIAIIGLPVAARNAYFDGEWSPTTFQAGPNFYIGNSSRSTGTYIPLIPGHQTPVYERADAARLAEQAEQRDLSAREVSQFWMRRAVQEIEQDPWRWLRLMSVKTLMLVNRYEVPDVESMYVYREHSVVLRVFRWWHFGVLVPLAVWGVVICRQRPHAFWLSFALLMTMSLAVVTFFVLGRYRQPISLLLIPFAAAGLVDLINRRFTLCDLSIPAVVTLSAVAIISNMRIHDETSLNATSLMNVGIAAAQSGDSTNSVRWLGLAAETLPQSPEVHFNLGNAQLLDGQPTRAIASFQTSIRLRPETEGVYYYLASAYEATGQLPEAVRNYRRASQSMPQDPRPQQALDRLKTDERWTNLAHEGQ